MPLSSHGIVYMQHMNSGDNESIPGDMLGDKVLGVTFQQLQKFERGDNKISASQLFKLVAHYGASVDLFLPPALRISGKEVAEPSKELEDVLSVAQTKQGPTLLYRYLCLDEVGRKRLVAIAHVLGLKLNDKP